MRTELVIVVVLSAMSICMVALRGFVHRFRLLRRLDRAELAVENAMDDGRLADATGESLLQHLDGLRRACSRGRRG